MQPVTSYKAFDGTIFDTAKECANYETHCKKIASIVDKLPRFEPTDEFLRGQAFYQHEWQVLVPIRDEFFMFLDEHYPRPDYRFQIGTKGWALSPSKYMEMIVATGDRPLWLAFYYFACIDDDFRQWSAMTFAKQPPEDAICIN